MGPLVHLKGSTLHQDLVHIAVVLDSHYRYRMRVLGLHMQVSGDMDNVLSDYIEVLEYSIKEGIVVPTVPLDEVFIQATLATLKELEIEAFFVMDPDALLLTAVLPSIRKSLLADHKNMSFAYVKEWLRGLPSEDEGNVVRTVSKILDRSITSEHMDCPQRARTIFQEAVDKMSEQVVEMGGHLNEDNEIQKMSVHFRKYSAYKIMKMREGALT